MDAGNPVLDFEAPKDPGAHRQGNAHVTDNEILGHRSAYVDSNGGPGGHHRHYSKGGGGGHGHGHHGRHRHHRGRHHHSSNLNKPQDNNRPVTPPSQRVMGILGIDDDDSGHEPHPLFSEMGELFCDANGEMEWHETARWVKFEEDVEEGGNRWSKPHVATLSLHSLFELRSMLLNGTICLDMCASNLDDICELLLDNMVNSNILKYDKKHIVKDAINKRHRHQYEGNADRTHVDGNGEHKKSFIGSTANNLSNLPLIKSLADIGKMGSNAKKKSMSKIGSFGGSGKDGDLRRNNSSDELENKNNHFMKKIPPGAEASNILVGELKELDKPLSAFIRLSEASHLGDLTEVPVPTRFLFILLGPGGEDKINLARYHEVGRAVATIFADEVFHDVAYKARKREHLLAGIDEFLDAVTVLPPGEWDPSIRIEPPSVVPSQDSRLKQPGKGGDPKDQLSEEELEAKEREESGLVRSGKLFGGLWADIKRKKPFYLSDFKDGLAVQSVASIIFIYFACLTPIITFGGLLGDATENRMASIESLVSGLIVGVAYGFFSGQPLTILGSTGPILVFESIVFDFCKGQGWEYLPFRFCIGMWILALVLILVATDASAFVCYITRFTEENFATLIAFIFIKKAFEKVFHIDDKFPLHPENHPCECKPKNETEYNLYGAASYGSFVEDLAHSDPKKHYYTCEFTPNVTENNVTTALDFSIIGKQSPSCHPVPNAFLMSLLLFFGTFLIAFQLKKAKTTPFFPASCKNFISDFAVIIAIGSMALLDYGVGVDTPKLSVPDTIRPTWEGRGWLIHPLGNNPWYTSLLAVVPAILGTILVFMDQQITAVIVNRKEHKLKKGCGYHLDLFIVAIMIGICSVFGLPWFVAATVLSINHVKSLTRESETAAPGEKPQFLGIREQRVTHIIIFILVGLSVLMTPVLSKIPMPVLYGVFLFMGVASLNGLQFFDRILLFFMPKKYQPDLPYLRRVPLMRVHLFTSIQLLCLVALWIIKDIKATSILFPVMLVVMMGIRKGLDRFFDKSELKILDDILPESQRHEVLDDEEALEGGIEDGAAAGPGLDTLGRRTSLSVTSRGIAVPMANGNVMMLPLPEEADEVDGGNGTSGNLAEINITEEVNRSGVWTSLEGNQNNGIDNKQKSSLKGRRAKKSKSGKGMGTLDEDNDEEETGGITIKASSKKSANAEDKED